MKLRYSEFYDRIDVDAFEEAIGFEPFSNDRGNDIGHCMFPDNHAHGDSTGKFAIEREKRLYNCFVCDGGTLLSLVMELYGWDVEYATEWIYQFADGEDRRSDEDFKDYLLDMLNNVEERVATMPYFNERTLEQFDTDPTYFRSRGISDEVIERYQLRSGTNVRKAAPIKVDRDGIRHKIGEDYVGPASIWPHYWQGRLVGWQYRWHDWNHDHTLTPRWLPKWTNTTDFPAGTTLFNYDRALKSKQAVVVSESLGTTLFCETYGFPAVAFFGSKMTEAQLRLLRRFTQGVILAPDNDSNMAGDKIYGAVDYLQRFVPVYIADKVAGPSGADLNDYAKDDDPGSSLQYHLEYRVESADMLLLSKLNS